MADCTILILTYKGKRHLEFLLPTIRTAIENYKGDFGIDVLIVDNGCDEETRDYATQHFPEYVYEYSPVNDYLFSLNPFVARLGTKYVLILNDDMKMHPELLNRLLPVIAADDSLFAVTCRVMDWDGTYTASAVREAHKGRGWMYHHFVETNGDDKRYTLYPGGGAAIFNTAYFNEVGGFNDLYRPAYCEDSDLGIVAWQKGLKVVYDPHSILYHREGGTIKDQFKKDRLETMIFKNTVLWNLKNVRLPGFLLWFFLLYPYRLLLFYFSRRNHFKGLLAATSSFGKALRLRGKVKGVRVKDEEWINMLGQTYNPPALKS